MFHKTASAFRAELFPLLKEVLRNHETVEIKYKEGDVILLSKEDYEQMQHQAALFRIEERMKTEERIPYEQVLAELKPLLENA